MIWLGLIAGILVAGMLLFAFSDMLLKVRFSHTEGDDHITLDVKGLYGLLRFRYVVPVLYWAENGLRLKTEIVNRNSGKGLMGDDNVTITRDKVEEFFQRTKQMLAYTAKLLEWTKGVLARTVCTEISWVTRVGLGDAADTAVTTGVVWGLKTSLLGFLFRYIRLEAKPVLSVQPQFNRMQFSTEGMFVLEIKAGYALYAVFMLLYRILRVKGGLKTWRKLLFKPS
ncbi:MAG: hypothetical protein K0R28_4814 [Paenibacillus sp.]|jgi:hypothetical protein|nr:hypothetical protein [Paenibacillus sp.]